ncbi:MAG: M20/M25/M40 family metallo-hydrolase [Faecalibacterium sp.]|nr:M20/M25/M40 family metallo-hydrolase [Ruminococcus sp.]MCM1391546.1 M20/M25/M40 family metallo-hydrolase [Ruminococcus sp.]MCM1485491.1 M20/M25/M40 family metallo-hydrolase [Faecalibacterium sp.]
MKKSTIAIGAAAAVGLVGNAVHAALYKPKKQVVPKIIEESNNIERYRSNLSKAIQIKTISNVNPDDTDWEQFGKFHEFLDSAYPLIAEKLEKEIVPPANLIYRWKGKNSKLDPVALCAHQDVVPVSDGTEQDWTHPAFSGFDDGEFIWGRGALDMKNHLICVMEAVETLLAEGFQPERDVYLLFGDNEEIVASKDNGATAIMNVLKDRGIHLESLLDEGGAMLPVNIKGVINNKYLAGIGVAEKGYADIEITLSAKGGHSSQPPKHTALGKMADVIKDLENNQFKASFSSSMKSLFDSIGRNCTYPVRTITCNLPLLYPALLQICKLIPPAACMTRTTTGITMAQGSPAANVLPQRASITVNFRAMPGTSVDDIVQHVKKVVKNKDIEIKVLKSKEASRFSPTDSRAFGVISRLCKAIEPNSIIAPFLVMGGTDAYFYEPICENIYRYAPFKVDTSMLLCTHGTNERIPIKAMSGALTFFKNYIREISNEL